MESLIIKLLITACSMWVGVSAQIKVRLAEIMNLGQYDGALRPQMRQGSTMVNVSMVLHSVLIDEANQVIDIAGELHQEWDDPGLGFPGSGGGLLISSVGLSGTSGATIQDQVWRPDLTAAYTVKPNPTNPHSDFIRINRDGHVAWTQRVHYSIPCPMDLRGYPMTSHSCVIKLHSLGYEQSELQPSWYGDAAVDHSNTMASHGFKLEGVKTSAKTIITIHKAKRQLRVTLDIVKMSGWTLKHTVIPMIAAVTTAYLSFFINIRGICARMITCMTSLVTAAIFHEGTYVNVPQASYTLAIEVFTGTSLAFIFIAALECVVIDVLAHLPAKNRRSSPLSHTSFDLEHDLTETKPSSTKGPVAAIWLDRCFRVLYPAAFLAFNGVYWVLYH